jgi:hypothetical protein
MCFFKTREDGSGFWEATIADIHNPNDEDSGETEILYDVEWKDGGDVLEHVPITFLRKREKISDVVDDDNDEDGAAQTTATRKSKPQR